jgi:hypothetical protein
LAVGEGRQGLFGGMVVGSHGRSSSSETC